MLSQLPTQQQATEAPETEQKKPLYTPKKKRPGQGPVALFVKAIFRPIFKGVYYLFRGVRRHKLVTLLAILIFIAAAIVANGVVTKTWPFIGAPDPVQSLTQHDQASGDNVRGWLYALRDGNANVMTGYQQGLIMQTPPDVNQLISSFSQAQANVTWKDISVLSVYSEPDTTLDSFIKIDVTTPGQSGPSGAILILHFVTLPQQSGRILFIDVVSYRQLLQTS
jgi:hypothetical protein